VPVRPDGKIAAPLVEDMPAAGKDPTTLARDMEKALAKYIRDPVVTVIVSGFVGPYTEQIRVVGEATKPQALPYKQKMTLLDVMIAVGGVTDFADGNGATILRASDGNKQYNVRLRDLLKRGDVSANVEMKPGDVLIIPQSWF
jgi:polysaccharide export outer membrane protein